MAQIRRLTCAEVLRFGLEVVGFDEARQRRTRAATNIERFRAAYGVGPGACSAVYRDLQTIATPDARINKPSGLYFLVALNWLATYKKEAEMAGFFRCDDKTLRNHIKEYVNAIAALKGQKIVWDDGGDELFLLSVDGVHFRINEPRTEPSAKWCSYKHKSAGLTYELGISIYKNRLVWINGPFKAATHDRNIFITKGLADKIPAGKKAVADRGYTGEKCKQKLAIRNRRDGDAVKEFKKRARARHENFNARIKRFKILEDRFRHGVKRHKAVMEAVCVLVQYDMENGHPLFDV